MAGPLAVMVAVGNGFTITSVADDVAEQPLPSVTVAVLFPPVFTLIVCVVAPVLHNHELPLPAVKFTEPPVQKAVAPSALMVAAGSAFTVTTLTAEVFEHPLPSNTVTVLLPALFAVIDCVVSPVLHK